MTHQSQKLHFNFQLYEDRFDCQKKATFIYKTIADEKNLYPVLCLFIASILIAQKTYIWCGALIDGISDEPKKNMTIVVEKDKITGIESGFTQPATNDKIIDLKTKTVTPGWIDMHVHVEMETKKGNVADRFILNPADIAFESIRYANVTLMSGFTTVRDLGGTGVNVSLRNAINKGWITGPRIYTAGKSIATTGGHADPTNGYRKDLMGDPGPKRRCDQWSGGSLPGSEAAI